MTREEILKLEGYDLNVAVAEKVMGIVFPTVEEMKTEAENQWKVQPECVHFLMGFDAWKEDGEFMWRYKTKNYSSDISAAWEIVERIKQFDDVDVAIVWHPKHEMYICNIGLISVAKYPTAPEAICKAALLGAMEE